MRTVRALALCLVLGAACKGNRQIGLEITLPSELVSATAWFEVGAYKDASCAAVAPMLGNGVPEGATARVAFRRQDAVGPRFGDIPNGKYAFAAVARDEECTILARGCREADVGDVDKVAIRMDAAEDETGRCAVGASCQAAKCVPANDNTDPSVGAGCSLELLGAGPLVNSAGGQGTLVSAPAIVATTTGFMIVYRELDPNGGVARLILLPLDPSGGALAPEKPGLPERCASSDETDGVGLVVKGEDAMVALARAPCDGKPALELLNFKTTNDDVPGVPTLGKFFVSSSPTGVRVALGPARASALRPQGGLVVFTEGGVGRIASMDPAKGIVGPNGTFGGTSGVTDAWVSASDRVLALLAAGVGGLPAGGDDDAGAGEEDPGDPATDPTLRLLMLPVNTAVESINATTNAPRAPITFPGEWGSIATLAGRVIVLSDGSGPGRSVTYRAFDLNRDSPADTSGFSVEGAGRVTAGDVTIVGNRAYFAALKQGAIGLHVYDNASTTLTPLSQVSFGREPRISAIGNVRDGRVSVAATPSRVAVAWTTAKVLGGNDPVGGYAVFACTD
ncbi:MAG: hypothetical protein KIS78_16290 [Labilithrix sp.]|nr:hypothetical protein [Labilithrix sp.]